ncbi:MULTISPECIES: NYN domain-containing protein [unclassified Nocardioides]|uniref:NYN domain-containing protein n=1 Tax=unclassified Nocardioides TaxID=2615069 RepID=UPI0006FBA2A3|nr:MULTISPECIES: NYN domain-containing protein [unclassified Nocardioides]KQY63920.1 hypothetical protein ASD30_02765 [Nocardioides sp. Root140]KRF15934.1 hypothetical protein ASH02_04770 [Nocardioides sp. Soil796]
MATDAAERTGGQMPEPVRARVLSLAADALPKVSELPASLRKVASFAPNRRARLGGTQIAAALETDDDFRGHLSTQVAATQPDLAEAIGDGVAPEAADPVELAAFLWLLRPEGWEASYADACARTVTGEATVDTAQLERLQTKVDQAEGRIKQLKAEHKDQVAELKTENASLRRKLGEARASGRSTSADAEKAIVLAEEVRLKAEAGLASAESESRRLRAQVEELQATLSAARREVRTDKDAATLRARVLLDTLLDAGQGLRRELALPTVTGSPADAVEADLALAGTRTPSAAGSLGPSSPALLEQFLAMPRARLIIDGYNVSKTAWPDSTLEAQRIRLLNGLAPLIARTGVDTTVVFDAAAQSSRGPVNAPRGVKVLFSPEGVIADDVIRDLVAAEPQGRVVVVVSSDREIAGDVRRSGAKPMASSALVALLAR